MDSLPPPSSWFSPEEIRRHAEGFIMGAAGILGLQKLGWLMTGKAAQTEAKLAVAEDRVLYLTDELKSEREEKAELRRENLDLKSKLAQGNG